jgi:hypothetical protein
MRRTLPRAFKVIFYGSVATLLAFAWFGFLNTVIEHGKWMHAWNGNARYSDLLEHGAVHGGVSSNVPSAALSTPDSVAIPQSAFVEQRLASGEVLPRLEEPSAPHPTFDSYATQEAVSHSRQSYQAGESFRLYSDEQISLAAGDAVPAVQTSSSPALALRPPFQLPAVNTPPVVTPPFQLPDAPAPAFQLPAAPACCTSSSY